MSGILLLIIFGLTYQMLIPARRFWMMGDVRSEVQINARLAYEKITRDIQSSSFDSVTTAGGTIQAISMLSPYNTDNTLITVNSEGEIVWQKYIIYYLQEGDERLYRKEVTNINVPSSTPTALTTIQLQNYCDGTGRVVAYSINSLNAVGDQDTSSVTLTITAQKELFSKNNTSVVSGTVTMNN
ncbi:MAG: hypothetical protein M1269_08285 [Chloroflexi bacterium]|nr:hypothetical protein [Chloroflexota bacterium]